MFEHRHSIIISGLSCTGKSSIAKGLDKTGKFSVVNAITTRKKRSDDFNYTYVNSSDFQKHEDKDDFIVSTSYLGNQYGILKTDYNKIGTAKNPVLILTAESANRLLETPKFENAIWFFIDADDDLLTERYIKFRHYNEKTINDLHKKKNEYWRWLIKQNYSSYVGL